MLYQPLWYFADRWTRFTSPNHASPDQQTDFHFRSWEDIVNQETQCDRGVHFIFSYLPVIPAATILDKTYSIMARGRYSSGLSDWSVWGASGIVMGFGILEEYMDAHQINEGFDFVDLACNFTGVIMAMLKHYGHIDFIDFYWSFNQRMFEESPVYGRYPWWIYMRGYEFALNIDVMSLLTHYKVDNTIFNLVIRTPGYIPELNKLTYMREI